MSALWFLVVVLIILWFLGAFVANVGNLVYLLLVIALVIVVYNLATGRRA